MMKTLIFGEHDSLPLVLRSLLKLRHGQIHFRGEWNGTVGEVSDLEATIEIHNKELIDLIFKNGVLGAAEGDWLDGLMAVAVLHLDQAAWALPLRAGHRRDQLILLRAGDAGRGRARSVAA